MFQTITTITSILILRGFDHVDTAGKAIRLYATECDGTECSDVDVLVEGFDDKDLVLITLHNCVPGYEEVHSLHLLVSSPEEAEKELNELLPGFISTLCKDQDEHYGKLELPE